MFDGNDSVQVWAFIAGVAIFCGLIGRQISLSRGGNGESGFWWGFLLGPVGLIVVALQGPPRVVRTGETATRECPFCKEHIRRDASVCPRCQRDVEPWQFREGFWWVKRDGEWWWFNDFKEEWTKGDEKGEPWGSR